MHLTLVRVTPNPRSKPAGPRPAKIVELEARRQARLEAARPEHTRPRPAA